MKTGLTISILLMITNYCLSLQRYISISGKILDSETEKPLAYASVGIKGQYIGTVANERGEFGLHIPVEFIDDTLYVSLIGYNGFSILIKDIDSNRNLAIHLDQRPTVLTEVVIVPGPTSQEKMRLWFKNIDKNYPTKPFMMEGFYRETRKANGRYVSLIEAAMELYDMKAYKNTKVKRVHPMSQIDEEGVIKQIRQSSNFLKQELEGEIGLQNNLLAYLLTQNPIKYPTRMMDSGNLTDSSVYLNNNLSFEITQKTKNGESKFYLDSESYGIFEIFERKHGQYHERKISDSVSLKYYDLFKTVKFRQVNELLYPQYYRTSWKVEKVDNVTKRMLLTLEVDLELLVSRIRVEMVTPPGRKEEMKIYSLEWQAGKYDPDFWQNYNTIHETPLQEKIRRDLEKEATLEQQFKNNQTLKPSKRRD